MACRPVGAKPLSEPMPEYCCLGLNVLTGSLVAMGSYDEDIGQGFQAVITISWGN